MPQAQTHTRDITWTTTAVGRAASCGGVVEGVDKYGLLRPLIGGDWSGGRKNLQRLGLGKEGRVSVGFESRKFGQGGYA